MKLFNSIVTSLQMSSKDGKKWFSQSVEAKKKGV